MTLRVIVDEDLKMPKLGRSLISGMRKWRYQLQTGLAQGPVCMNSEFRL